MTIIHDPKLKFGRLTKLPKVEKIIVHHVAHQTWTIQDIHHAHSSTSRNNAGIHAGIGYNYFVTFDGRAQKGRGREHQGAHAGAKWNNRSLGVCFQGNFEVQKMTDEQVATGAELIAELIRTYGLSINDVIPHKAVSATVCPGKNFRMNDLKAAILDIINPKAKPKPKEDENKMKLSENQWKMIADSIEELYENKVFTDKNWIKKAKNKTLTASELNFLNTMAATRLLRKGGK